MHYQRFLFDDGYDDANRLIDECRRSGDESLDLSSLGLWTLPQSIGQLKTLRTLQLQHNNLRALPSIIGQLVSLEYLDVSTNQLNLLPPEVGQLTMLRILNLFNNQLRTLPPEIGQLTALTELILSNNQINSLSPEIRKLTALTTLSLYENRLSTLPPELGQLTRLEQLILSGNCLSDLPKTLAKLDALKELTLHDNSLGIPSELLGPNWGHSNETNPPAHPQVILDFYFSRRDEGEEPMREVRLLLVGRGRVGKTSLLKSLRGKPPDKYEPETPGITVQPLELNCPQGPAIGHVWDFGGQEFLHGTHQIFLAERCVYLLVLEGRESNWETETDYWLRFIQSFGGDSPVVVVLTKYDAHPFSVDRFRLQERCPQIAGFIECDAFTGRGVEDLKELLATTVNEMKDVWLGVPKKWHRVKQQLTEMSQNFLDYKEYQSLCQQTGVNDSGKQDSLAQTLHRLGIALNFRDHHRLRETSVLKPQWVTEAIYGLIRYVQKQDCHGVLQKGFLPQALNAVDYPPEKYDFVLELMEKFEVAFPMEGTENWLIPELLREEQPETFEEFRGSGVRRLRFAYPDALPPGLLPRFIVRTHEMSEAHPKWRWRSGVVLEWSNCKALVRLNRAERRTEVAVIETPADDRQSLFDLIRAHLTVLHGKVRAIEEVELEGHPDSWVGAEKLRLLEEEGTNITKEATKEGTLATINVTPTLDLVESREAREAEGENPQPRMRLFVSYAHDDTKQIKKLSKHLTILGQRGYIQAWDDRELISGEEWEERIKEELARTNIVLLLYSTHSRASRFIQEIEGPEAVKRANAKDFSYKLIVVPLDRNDWDTHSKLEQDLKKFQTATWNAKPVLEFPTHAKGWLEVEHAIRKAVEAMRQEARGIPLRFKP